MFFFKTFFETIDLFRFVLDCLVTEARRAVRSRSNARRRLRPQLLLALRRTRRTGSCGPLPSKDRLQREQKGIDSSEARDESLGGGEWGGKGKYSGMAFYYCVKDRSNFNAGQSEERSRSARVSYD